jgi:hypothetical protein
MDHDARARAFFHALQDSVVLQNWKTEQARSRYIAARTPLFPAVYWNRTNAEANLASAFRRVDQEARASERERCAKVAEDDYTQCSPSDIAAAIRALGDARAEPQVSVGEDAEA